MKHFLTYLTFYIRIIIVRNSVFQERYFATNTGEIDGDYNRGRYKCR